MVLGLRFPEVCGFHDVIWLGRRVGERRFDTFAASNLPEPLAPSVMLKSLLNESESMIRLGERYHIFSTRRS